MAEDPGDLLLRAWRHLADQWGDSPRGARLRSDVISLFEGEHSLRTLRWWSQAQALSAWHEISKEVETPTPDSEWSDLRDACRDLRQRIDAETQTQRGRIFGLLPGREPSPLLQEVAEFLSRCQPLLARQAATVPIPERPTQRIEQALSKLPPLWPPVRLAQFQFALGPNLEAVTARLQESLPLAEAAWSSDLPELGPSVRDLLLLLRAILDACAGLMPSPWPAYASLARELLPADRWQIELIRDPKLPREWFETPVESEVPAPQVERVGLAIRVAGKSWFYFPRGRLLLPKPRPRNAARDAWEALVRAAEGSRIAVLLEEVHDGETDESFATRIITTLTPSDLSANLLSAVREWAHALGLTVLPARWPAEPIIQRGEPRDGCDCEAQFSTAPAGTILNVRRFGLMKGDDLLQACSLVVSAGAAPDGFDEFEHVVEESDSSLAGRLQDWRLAALDGTLDLVAVQYFVDFWGDAGEELRRRDPDRAREIGQRLGQVLQTGCRLFPFSPAAYQDYPDGWLQRIPGRQMISGRVLRVVRPGLHDEQNHLRVPALVEVE